MMFNGYFHYLDAVRYANGVATVPVFDNGDVLLVRLPRAPAFGMSIEFPRGGVDPAEDLADAARRELSEETGYTVSAEAVTHLGRLGADTATINCFQDVYLVRIPDNAYQGAFDTEEIDKPLRVSRQAFEAMIRGGQIFDAITLASWALATLHLSNSERC